MAPQCSNGVALSLGCCRARTQAEKRRPGVGGQAVGLTRGPRQEDVVGRARGGDAYARIIWQNRGRIVPASARKRGRIADDPREIVRTARLWAGTG